MKELYITLLFLLLKDNLLYTQSVIPLYEKEIPNSIPAANIEARTARPNGTDWVSNVSIPALSFYPATDSAASHPAIIICPGGGYGGLAIEHEGHAIAKELNQQGITAFVLKYRMPSDRTMIDKSIGPLQDLQQAILLVRTNAAKWNIDAGKVGVMGFSAGGHLASTAATHFHTPVIATKKINVRPDFAMLIYPVITFKDSLTHIGSRKALLGNNPPDSLIRRFSNEEQVTTDSPPTFIIHAGDDNVVPVGNALSFYHSLQKKNINAQLFLYPRGGHGFGLHNPTTSDKWLEHGLRWLKENILFK